MKVINTIMRKLFNIFLFVLCTIAIAGCNDTESSESRLEIKAVNTNFQATGGKGLVFAVTFTNPLRRRDGKLNSVWA